MGDGGGGVERLSVARYHVTGLSGRHTTASSEHAPGAKSPWSAYPRVLLLEGGARSISVDGRRV
jgi:hypothetical protein